MLKKSIILVLLLALLISMAHEMLGPALASRGSEFLVRPHPSVSREVMDRRLAESGGCEVEWVATGDLAATARVLGRRVSTFGKPWRLSLREGRLALEVAQVTEREFHDLVRVLEAKRSLAFHEVLDELAPGDAPELAEGEWIAAEDLRRSALHVAKGLWNDERTLKPRLEAERRYRLSHRALLDASHLRASSLTLDPATKAMVLRLAFHEAGARILKAETARLVGRRLALVAADRVIAAPVVREAIEGPALEITGDFDPLVLANVLACGEGGDHAEVPRRVSCRFIEAEKTPPTP